MSAVVLSILALMYEFYQSRKRRKPLTSSTTSLAENSDTAKVIVRKHKVSLAQLLNKLAQEDESTSVSPASPDATSQVTEQKTNAATQATSPKNVMRESFGTVTIDTDSPDVINLDGSMKGNGFHHVDEKAGDSSPERQPSTPSSRKGTTIGSSKRRAKKVGKKHIDAIFDKSNGVLDEEMSGLVAASVGRRRSSASIRGLDVALNVLEDILAESAVSETTTGHRLRTVTEIISQSKAELVNGKTVTKRDVKTGEDKEVASWLRSGFLNVAQLRESVTRDGDQKQDDAAASIARTRWQDVIKAVSDQTRHDSEDMEYASKEDVDEIVSIVRSITPKCLSKITSWDEFDVFELNDLTDGQPLVTLAWYLFEQNDLFDKFAISKTTFLNVLTSIEGGYNEVPYHNNVHAADVMANTYYFILSKPLSVLLTRIDMLASLIAAGIHDFRHPGTNNLFSIAVGDDFAVTYNDRSVLENMHVSEAFRLFKKKNHDLFESLSPNERKEVRQTIISMVLATDMSQHLKYSSDLEASIKAKKEAGSWFKTESYEDRLVCLNMALHVADLGNPAKPLRICLEWTQRVSEEFFRQGDKEKELGLPISPMMNREKPNIGKSQLGFIDYVILPLFKLWSQLIPEESQCCLDNIKFNRQHWESQLAATILSPTTPSQ